MGDINVQPAELGGNDPGREPRRRLWSELMEKFGISLANPSMDDNEIDVLLPLRSKVVRVGAGSTHHCAGLARALDIIGSSACMDLGLAVHNGIHCKSCVSCSWDEC